MMTTRPKLMGRLSQKEQHPVPSPVVRLEKHLLRRIGAGFLVLIPLLVTLLVIQFFVQYVDGFERPLPFVSGQPWDVPGLGLAIAAVVLYMFGVCMTIRIGKRTLDWKSKVGSIPKDIKKHLRWRHRLSERELDRLWCALTRRCRFAGEKIMSVRIFDPILLEDRAIVRQYKDLDGRPPALLFEGRWWNSGSKYNHFSVLPTSKASATASPVPRSENGSGGHIDVEEGAVAGILR